MSKLVVDDPAILMSAGSADLKGRSLRASAWILSGHASGQLIRLVSNLIMTKLLAPDMFGVMAIANLLIVSLAMFSDVGLRQSIMQSRHGDEPSYLNTAWTLQILRGVLLCLSALFLAGLAALAIRHGLPPPHSVYADPLLPGVIAMLSVLALVNGFESTKVSTAGRHLALGRITLIELGSQSAGLLFMVAWGLHHPSIWTLVGGALFASAIRVVAGHAWLPGSPNRLEWNPAALSELFHFGKWIFLTSILGFLSANGDRLLLGWLTNSATLGIYVIAFLIVNALQEVFVKLMGSVSFPVLSAVVREHPAALKAVYYRFRSVFDVATLLACGLAISSGQLVIRLLYDSRYQAAGHMLEILAIALFETRYGLAGQCFMALGKPKLLAPIILVRLLALFILMPIAFHLYGLDGALWIAGGSVLFTLPLTLYFKVRYGIFELAQELRSLPWLAAGCLAGYAISLLAGRAT